MALDGLLTSLRSKARGISLSFYLAATSLLVSACGEKSQPTTAEQTNDCTTDRDCEPDEACMDGSCKSIDVGQYILEGIVKDWTTGELVDGVGVAVKRDKQEIARDTTDARGHYQLSQLSEGTYAVTWERDGYLPNTKEVQLLGADKRFDVELAPERQRLNFDINAFDIAYVRHADRESDIERETGYNGFEHFFSVAIGQGSWTVPEFIKRYSNDNHFEGVILRFVEEAARLQVLQNQLVSYEPYHEENGNRYYQRGFSAKARIPFEYYRFKMFEDMGRHGFIFYAKIFDAQQAFQFECRDRIGSMGSGMEGYCEVEDRNNERICLSDKCNINFTVTEMDVYTYGNINESY